MAAAATVVVAANLLALTVVSPQELPKRATEPSRAHARATNLAQEIRRSDAHAPRWPPTHTRGLARGAVGPRAPRGHIATVQAALRQAARFAHVYARYRNHPLDRAGIRQLRRLASLQLADTLTAQPPLGAGGRSARMRVAGTPRLALVSARAAIVDSTLVAGTRRHRVRCLLIRERHGWAIVGFRYE
jgi:hypothetical protein